MKTTKLYNVIFPIWMLYLFPVAWLVVLPGNFLVDSLVLLGALYALRVQDKKQIYKRYIVKAFFFGLLADLVGTAFLFLTALVFEVGGPMCDSPTVTVPAMLISAGCIFLSDYFITFRRMEKPLGRKLALIFAVATAPYTFLIPVSWFY